MQECGANEFKTSERQNMVMKAKFLKFSIRKIIIVIWFDDKKINF